MAFGRNLRRRARRAYAQTRGRFKRASRSFTRSRSRVRNRVMGYMPVPARRRKRRYSKKPNLLLYAILLGGAFIFKDQIGTFIKDKLKIKF